ncbi:MAG: gas vesicle protein GvpN [Candidatus Magnetoglobus multicellularis str. Araruama]|uniref:Gas vesicle protein GvpN n=1 Tax=Candidatus Magnetoglobus multicellularis str. Araruama TaxID=890399 RepID=A0A1V1P1I0_9BACT|nr:MAG: gas vesicle protein GvpN [Candidatus Magnetoglobus multicellularis str. Araruama]
MTNSSPKNKTKTPELSPRNENQVHAEPSQQFVNSSYVHEITERAMSYMEVGYPIHLSGPAGIGKTTLAFHIAAQLGQPVTLIHGDDEFRGSDLIGRDSGYKKTKVVDNYIHTVLRTEEELMTNWVDNRLTTACINGYTLIYDEFTRSKPEANNSLLSILEEKILNLPKLKRQGDGYIEVHPNFKAIFTSNPEEYVGVHKTQDALMDRLITMKISHYNRETEILITQAKSGIPKKDAESIVSIVRELRKTGVNNHRPTIRACIAIAKVVNYRQLKVNRKDKQFRQVCHDVLHFDSTNVTRDGHSVMENIVDETIEKILSTKKQNIK